MTAIQQAVLSIVLTSKGEKPFDYDYGVGIYDYLFENLDYDDIPIIASEVERQLTKYEPRVLFDEIIINQNEYTLDVKINYYVSVKSSGQPPLQSVNLSLTKVR